MIEATPDLMFRIDRDGKFLDFQASDESLLYVPPGEIVGKNLRETMPADLAAPMFRRVAKAIETGEMQIFENRLPVSEGPRDFEARLVASGPGEALAIVRDVTERKSLERQLEHRAFHDPLTDLPNRALFVDRLGHALAGLERSEGKGVAVLFVDLDDFKVVNDSLRHMAGDHLLVAVARRLRARMRPEDTLARFGGDEFAVLLEDVEGAGEAAQVAERISEELRASFTVGGREIFASPSIGISLGTTSSDRAEDLLRKADTALYRAKARGKARHAVFGSGMHAAVLKRLRTESDLRRALERGEFRVFYQPKMGLGPDLWRHPQASGSPAMVAGEQGNTEAPRIVGTEALVRWEHPDLGLVPPTSSSPLRRRLA